MKRLFAALLAGLMIVSLCGCGGETKEGPAPERNWLPFIRRFWMLSLRMRKL